MEFLIFHLGYVLYSLILMVLFAALLFSTAFAAALYDLAKERRTRRRKESRNA